MKPPIANARLLLTALGSSLEPLVTTEKQLDAEMTWAHPIEIMEPEKYLREGELLCTVGTTLLTREACEALCRSVVETGATGICFGVGDAYDHVPPVLIHAAEEFSIMLLALSGDVPFTLINDILQEARSISSDFDSGQHYETELRVTGRVFDLIADGLASPRALKDYGALDSGEYVLGLWRNASRRYAVEGHSELAVATGIGNRYTYLLFPAEAWEEAGLRTIDYPCGFSGKSRLDELPRAIHAAEYALELSLQSGSATGPHAITTLNGLLRRVPLEVLVPFREQLIQPLVEMDLRRNTQLVNTLRVFLQLEGSVQQTANATFLHVNSVRHRLSRIHEIVGIDPLQHSDRVSLQIGLWAHDRSRHYRGNI